MSKDKVQSAKEAAEDHLQEVRVESLDLPRRHSDHPSYGEKARLPKISSRSTDYVYVNQAYVGSTNSVMEPRISPAPVTSEVIREQYWACSKWPFATRILAIAVGVLFGAVVGLVVVMVVKGQDADEVIGGIFTSTRQNMEELVSK